MTTIPVPRPSSLRSALFAFLLVLCPSPATWAEDDEALGFERTPPRLSLTDGEVSFWRSGATDWAPAHVNTPLAEGDELYTGGNSNLEIQIGGRAYARAGENTQLGLTNVEPDYLQLRVARGVSSLDVRSLSAGHTLEVDTPNAAFTIEHSGYYRVEVDEDTTHFSSRRGGYASVTTANGGSAAIAPSEQVVISGTDQPTLETYAAPDLDGWDRWNYERTDQLIDALSSRYVPSGVYGADDLDHYGNWRVVPTYGAVWFPHVAAGWVPYSTGTWMYDPYYGWTWVDAAPWGWAPFHHGRWVFVGDYWAWAPGPRVVRTYYAPALVAFYGAPGFSISIGIGHHPCGWVALGWGEPLAPWWGPTHWRHSPRWAGWGGPRIVNNVVVNNTTIVNVNHIEGYANASRRGAIVAVDRRDFGRRDMREARLRDFDTRKLRPVHGGEFDVKPGAVSLVGTDRPGRRPPKTDLERSVVATREPRRAAVPALDTRAQSQGRVRGTTRGAEESVPDGTPPARVVTRERKQTRSVPERPPFGSQAGEERAEPPRPPRYHDMRRQRGSEQTEREATRVIPSSPGEENHGQHQPQREPADAARTAPAPQRNRGDSERAQGHRRERSPEPTPAMETRPEPTGRTRAPEPQRDLPGEPANRVFRGRPSGARSEGDAPAQAAPSAPTQTQTENGRQSYGDRDGGGHGHGRGSGPSEWKR